MTSPRKSQILKFEIGICTPQSIHTTYRQPHRSACAEEPVAQVPAQNFSPSSDHHALAYRDDLRWDGIPGFWAWRLFQRLD